MELTVQQVISVDSSDFEIDPRDWQEAEGMEPEAPKARPRHPGRRAARRRWRRRRRQGTH